MSRLIPSEEELHAYVDEHLEPGRRREVELYLAANPEQAARIEGWRADARQLRAALAGLAEQPLNPRLHPAAVRRDQRQRRQRHWATAAMLLVALGVGGLGGWQAREAGLLASSVPPMADAVQAHRLFAYAAPLDIAVERPAQLQAWLMQHFHLAGQLPDLSTYGFTPVGARLLSNEQGPAALLVFQDAKGERISLFLRSPGERYARMPTGERVEGQLQARYWSHGAYNYALVSEVADGRGAQIRQALDIAL